MKERTQWYWKDGTPIIPNHVVLGSKEWIELMKLIEEKHRDWDYRCIGRTKLWWGGLVSTVWIGLDMSWELGKHKPLFLESMVFSSQDGELDMNRYSTEQEAKEGHKELVNQWSNPLFLLTFFVRSLFYSVYWRIYLAKKYIFKK